MLYEYSDSACATDVQRMRRRICLTAEACLYMRLSTRAPVLLGRLTGKQASARLVRDLVAFAREPLRENQESVFKWAMNYGSPALVRRLIKSLAASRPEHWALKIMAQSDSDLLLPRDHMTPDVQIMQTSACSPKNALICFTGNSLKLNMPVQLFHCAVVGKFDLLIYLRDKERKRYAAGIPGLGESLEELATGLADRLPRGNCRVSVLGTSGGGVAASCVANKLHARRLALFSPPSLSKSPCPAPFLSVKNVNDVRVFFARRHPEDQRRAGEWRKHVSGLPQIEWLNTTDHGTLHELAATEGLDTIGDWLACVQTDGAAGPAALHTAGAASGY